MCANACNLTNYWYIFSFLPLNAGSIIAKREALEEGRCVTSRDCGIGKKCHRWNLDVLHQNHPLGWCDGGSPDRGE